METPETKIGDLTEKIMRIFWREESGVRLDTTAYNRVYSHVVKTLENNLPKEYSELRLDKKS